MSAPMTERMVSVPVEPTEEMIQAFYEATEVTSVGTIRSFVKGWTAMLTAAPVREEGGAETRWLHDAISLQVRLSMQDEMMASDANGGRVSARIERANKAADAIIAALRAQPVGWLRAVDEEMVCAHLGVADAEDSFETAKKKLASLIQWNIAVATDPSVGGHPAPDALREKLEAAFTGMRTYSGVTIKRIDVQELVSRALAALQAEQGAK